MSVACGLRRREILTLGEGFNTQVITLWCFYIVLRGVFFSSTPPARAQAPRLIWGHVRCVYYERAVEQWTVAPVVASVMVFKFPHRNSGGPANV